MSIATKPDQPKVLKEANRQVREALRDCEHLLESSAFLLRQTNQDNDPVKP